MSLGVGESNTKYVAESAKFEGGRLSLVLEIPGHPILCMCEMLPCIGWGERSVLLLSNRSALLLLI